MRRQKAVVADDDDDDDVKMYLVQGWLAMVDMDRMVLETMDDEIEIVETEYQNGEWNTSVELVVKIVKIVNRSLMRVSLSRS